MYHFEFWYGKRFQFDSHIINSFIQFQLAVEAVGNIRTVAGLGREKTFHQQYMLELHPAHEKAQRNTHVRGVVFGLARSIMFFAYATAMYYGGQLVVQDGVPFEDILK